MNNLRGKTVGMLMSDKIEEKNDIEKLDKSVRDLFRLVIELSDRVTALEDGYAVIKE